MRPVAVFIHYFAAGCQVTSTDWSEGVTWMRILSARISGEPIGTELLLKTVGKRGGYNLCSLSVPNGT